MRLNATESKRNNFIKKCNELAPLIKNYNPGEFNDLSKICTHLNAIVEYVQSNIYTDANRILRHSKEFSEYLEKTYHKRIFLVLKEQNTYSYTPNKIIKFLRGEGDIHGGSDLKKPERIVLHNFLYEKGATTYPELEFAITFNWIIYPGVKSSEGNGDSYNAFVHTIKFDGGNEKQLTAIESIVLAIALDFHHVISSGQMAWGGRVAITNNLDAFRLNFGDKIVSDLLSQEPWMLNQIKNSKHS